MSTFRSAMRLARAVLPSGAKKSARRLGAKMAPARRRRAQAGRGIVTKKFSTLEDSISVANGAFVNGNETFELADMPQFAQYVALYEQFKISKVVYHFRTQNPQQSVAVGPTCLGYLHTVVDHNDVVNFAPSRAGIQNMMNDNAYKGVKSDRDLTRVIRPMFLTQAGTQTAKSTRGWLNTKDVLGNINAVSHYGIKWVIEGGVSATANPLSCQYQPIITYYIQFKNPQ